MRSLKRNKEPIRAGSSSGGKKTTRLKFPWLAAKPRVSSKAAADDQQPNILSVAAGPSSHAVGVARVESPSVPTTMVASAEAANARDSCRTDDTVEPRADKATSTIATSLWDLAYDALREEKPGVVEAYEELLSRISPYLAAEPPTTDLRDLLSKASSSPPNLSPHAGDQDNVMTRRKKMDDMIALGQKHMEGKKIALKVGDQEFMLQDQMKQVVAGIRLAKGWIDDAVNANPLARVAWASVCLLLPLLTNRSEVQAANDEGFAYVTQKTRYYAAMESLLFGGNDRTFPPAFRDRVIELYKEIIGFQVQTVLRFFRSRFSNFVRDTVKCDPWEEMLKRVKGLGADVERESLHIISALARDALGILARRAMESEENKCLQSLRRGDYAWYKDRIEDRAPDTCLWFLTHERYQSWLTADSGPLLVSADPGCGKSVLAKYLVDSRFGFTLPKDAAICYFFFKDGDQCTVDVAFCALIHQLLCLRPWLIRHALPRYKQDGNRLATNITALWDILEVATADPEAGTVVIVLDALDECLQDERNMSTLSRYITTHFEQGGRQSLKILMTARPYEGTVRAIQALERTFPNIRIKGEDDSETIRKEINTVIEYQVDRLDKFNDDPRLKPHLKKRLMDITHRTYLWLYLIFKHLEDPTIRSTVGGLNEAINDLPPSVDHAYENILGRSTKPEETKKALRILLAAYRPLTLRELQIAMRVTTNTKCWEDVDLESDEAFKQRLRELCGLFVTEHAGKVYFLHQTAREFLLGPACPTNLATHSIDGAKWAHSISIGDGHMALAEACIVYLCVLIVARHPDTGDNLRSYSVENWVHHFREADVVEGAAVLPYALDICNRNSPWFVHSEKYKRISSGATTLIIASIFGFTTVVLLLLESGAEVEARDQDRRTPLSWAAKGGYDAVVRLLLERGATVESRDQSGRTPLSWAAERGHKAVVHLLLEKGAQIESRDLHGRTPLFWAAAEGHDAVVRLLLENGAETKSTDQQGRTPLFLAAGREHVAVVRLLLENGAEAELRDQQGRTPLSLAAELHERTEWLLDKTFDIDLMDQQDQTPVSRAVGREQKALVRLLLENGANTASTDPQGRSPLSLAAKNGFVAVVQQLLEKGAEIDSRDQEGRTPLSLAAEGLPRSEYSAFWYSVELDSSDQEGWMPQFCTSERRHEAVVWLLLENGAEIESRDQQGRTPLSWAAAEGQDALVRLLLEKGADIESWDEQGRTPVYVAAEGGHDAVVRSLLERGARIEPRDQWGRTPLSRAVQKRREAVVRLLLEKGADIDSRDQQGRTLLSLAAKNGFVAMVQLLLEKGAEIESRDQQGWTPLSWAAESWHKAMVRQLHEDGTEIESCAVDEWPPWAEAESHEAVMRLLVEKGAQVDSRDRQVQMLLCVAAETGYDAVVRLMLEKGAQIDSRDQWGRTPLSRAAQKGREAVVRLLLENGADIELRGQQGRTPLSWAAKGWHEAMMRRLHEERIEFEWEIENDIEFELGIMPNADFEWKDKPYKPYWTPPYRTEEREHKTVVCLLLEKTARIDSRDQGVQMLLFWGAELGHEDLVRLLLEKGAEIESRDQQGRTPLSWAAGRGHEAVVRLLLEMGAEIESRDQERRTPLSLAAAEGHNGVVQLLLAKGAEIESRDNRGRSPLSWAAVAVWAVETEWPDVEERAERDYEAVVQLLLEKGAEVESRDQQGRTPLSWAAAEWGGETTAPLLLEKGADIESRDQEGRTPLSWAASEGQHAVARLLLEKGADTMSTDQLGRTPLSWAAIRHRTVARLLRNYAV